MRLAIVGSTSFPSLAQKRAAGVIIEGFVRCYGPEVIISGGAEGVDTWAEETARFWGYSEDEPGHRLIIHRPKNHRWEPEGYKDRNLLIAQDCTHLLAIRSIHGKTYGSGWTADQAEKLGKTVWRVYL